MKCVVQRVNSCKLSVNSQVVAEIKKGIICYLAIKKGDTEDDLKWLANKIAKLRIFPDENSKMNFSILDLGFEILVVPQFTLYANLKKGYRPSFTEAEEPQKANQMFELFCEELLRLGITKVSKGVFGADMNILQENQGPVTIIIESNPKTKSTTHNL